MIIIMMLFLFSVSSAAEGGHVWTKWIISKQPTCTEEGEMYRICTADPTYQHTEIKKIDKLEHSYEVKTISATCTEPEKKVYTCKVCGHTETKVTANAKGHQYETTEIAATCTEYGKIIKKCKVCGHEEVEKGKTLAEHKYKVTKDTPPTCKAKGIKTYTCSVCGKSYTEEYGELVDHQFVSETHEENGENITIEICSVCGLQKEVSREAAVIPTEAQAVQTPETTIPETTVPATITEPVVTQQEENDENKKLAVASAAAGGADVGALAVLGLLIYPDIRVLKWYKNRRRLDKLFE